MSGSLVAEGVTKRYRRTLALDHCSFAIPEGAIVALVGPNGAGKSTLLHCATGLTRPTAGTIRVLGGEPGDRTLPGVGFVAQDAPLYRNFTADELLTMGDKLNRDFDDEFGRERLVKVGVPLDRKVDKLSGGQHAQWRCASRSPSDHACCSSTNPSPASTHSPDGSSSPP